MLSKLARPVRNWGTRSLSSYSRGADLDLRKDVNLNDILLEACETHADKVQCMFLIVSFFIFVIYCTYLVPIGHSV